MTNPQPKIERANQLPLPVAESLLHWGLALADTKLRLGLQLSNWVTGTPALEAAVGSAAITQDELGHARTLFNLLRTLPDAPAGLDAGNDLEARTVYYAPPALFGHWENWLDIIAANVLLDRALQIAVEATKGSAFTPLASLTGKMLQEEKFHRIYGDTWFTRLAASDEQTRADLQAAVERLWALTIIWLGPTTDTIIANLTQAGILTLSAAQMQAQWRQQVTALLTENGLPIPSFTPDWSKWDSRLRACR